MCYYSNPGGLQEGTRAVDISYFLEFNMIVKHGNLSEAAKELNTTQPVLSRHISRIEKEFGITLFDRHAKPMELTDSGALFLKESTLIANEYGRLVTCFKGFNEGSLETIKIGGLLDCGASNVFRNAKTDLVNTYPNMSIKIAQPSFQTSFDSLRDKEIDIAIEPFSYHIDIHGLESIAIITEHPYVVVDKSHGFAAHKEISGKDLKEISFTSPKSNRSHALRKHLQGICGAVGLEGSIPKSFGISNVGSYSELFLLGLDGEAVMLPESMALMHTATSCGQYVAIPLKEERFFYDIRAFYLTQPTQKTSRFIERLQIAAESPSCTQQGSSQVQ
ncbi:MAG: LysR family transcriptional regulator [Coriobacteriaceae bacterium]|nr:LysR family transcriptional regulator [Coriobacteriaceae bacterium]